MAELLLVICLQTPALRECLRRHSKHQNRGKSWASMAPDPPCNPVHACVMIEASLSQSAHLSCEERAAGPLSCAFQNSNSVKNTADITAVCVTRGPCTVPAAAFRRVCAAADSMLNTGRSPCSKCFQVEDTSVVRCAVQSHRQLCIAAKNCRH